jgi:hypothetical protein
LSSLDKDLEFLAEESIIYMSSNEQADQKITPYFKVARFSGERPAGQAYTQAQELIYRAPECELSVYRLQLDATWHVAILGEQPRRTLQRRLETILSSGEPASLPEEILRELQRRRAQATKLGPWVERHLRQENRN